MKKFNVSTPKKYTKNGEEKTAWLEVGVITEFDDKKQVLELNMFPNQKFFIFEREEKKQEPQGTGLPNSAADF